MSGDVPQIAAVVLAAGRSTRMGAHNKLLADLDGKAVVRHVAEAALASRARPVLVVTGHMAAEVAAVLAGLDVRMVANPDYATGLASSLKAGIGALPSPCAGALVLLGDMPQISPEHIDRLIGAFLAENGMAIIVPTHRGRRGNPVLWPSAFFSELLYLGGDVGAKRLLREHAHQVTEVDLGTDAIFADIDTPEALAQLRGR
ncbi:MAG: nucleotidyltransferase family protein [Hyphomonadaceae bacterium]|nr:nucleotidyltransferase family protein [Hyphomonadaceae bacterium]